MLICVHPWLDSLLANLLRDRLRAVGYLGELLKDFASAILESGRPAGEQTDEHTLESLSMFWVLRLSLIHI